MEFLFPAFLLFCLFLPLPLLLLVTRKASSQISGINLPPGNTGWPVIGESLQFLKAGREGTPEKFINERMQLFSSQIFKTSLFAESTAVFCGPSGNKFLYSNENKLVTAWWPRSVDKIFPFSQKTSNKEEAMKMRKLLPSFLKPEALQRYIGTMDMLAKTHLQTGWHNKDVVMVFPLANDYAFSLACRLFLSIDDPQVVAKFAGPFALVASAIISIPLDLPGTPFNRGLKAANFIRKELHTIIKQRKIDLAEKKASPTQDILSHMLLTTDENGEFMNEMDIASKILGLLIGGHDTASVAITSIVNYLAELPDIYNEVLREQTEVAKSKKSGDLLNWEDVQKMRYSWNVACEVMRLAPPVQGSFREAITDFTYAGFSIPKGWKLYWSANSTHRNPDYFVDPEKFDPSRFEGKGPAPYTYVPFGGGPRMCPGKEYARLEILVFMHNLVRKFRWDKLLKDEKIIVDPMPIPAKGLPVRLLPHDHHQMNSLCID